ncbi:NB-ARC domain-containing protein [Streptomyces sp. NPDC056401]|uniref:NB-ARC domain-containing protein n=1 Tax=Streptomyces sp. NPDC056401 TaxID=3345809 RepID=UPI0035E0A812
MGGIDIARVAEVIVTTASGKARRGSGYLVAAGRVLTAAHVVTDASVVRVRFDADRSGERVLHAEVTFTDDAIDVAVLSVAAVAAVAPLPDGPARFGRVGEHDAVLQCSAVGFPAFKLREEGDGSRYRDSEHVHGSCSVLSNRREGTLDLRVPAPDGTWDGMSGAAVFSDGRIVGIVVIHHLTDGPGRLAVSRADRWAERLPAAEQRALEELLGTELSPGRLPDVLSAAHSARTPFMAPPVPRHFVPRHALGRTLKEALHRPVSLCGAGGFGKTTLAAWVCGEEEIRSRFPDGVLWVRLGPSPTAEQITTALAGLAAVLTGGAPVIHADVPSATQAFRSALAQRQVLLVVDDVWAEADLQPFRNAGTLLITTRRKALLGDQGTEIPVAAMDDDEALALLGLPDESPTLEPLLIRAGHWPLALGLLSGPLRSLISDRHARTTAEAVAELLGELDREGIVALDELSDVDMARGISLTLEVSLADLPVESRGRFFQLAAFPEGETIPYRLLRRLWGVSELRARAEGDRFMDRSLASPARDGAGVRLHDVTREALRLLDPDGPGAVSTRLLDALRPVGGWHALVDEERAFLPTLAFHLVQSGGVEELASLVRDMRFLVARLTDSGPVALEGDLERCDTAHARELAELLGREGHLLTGGLSAADIALTLESRLAGSPELLAGLCHLTEARPAYGLTPLLPPPDRDDGMLRRSFFARDGDGVCEDMDWHPRGELLAVAGEGPAVRFFDASGQERGNPIEIPEESVIRIRWSRDGRRLALISRRLVRERYVHTLRVFDPVTGAQVDALPSPEPAFCWAPESDCLAVVCRDDAVDGAGLWEPGSGKAPRVLPGAAVDAAGGRSHVAAMDWHAEHGLLACTAGDTLGGRAGGALVLWAAPRGPQPPAVWPYRDFCPRSQIVAWGPTPEGVAWRTGGHSALVQAPDVMVVDPRARRVLWRAPKSSRPRWSPDGRRLMLGGNLEHAQGERERLSLWRMPVDADLARGKEPVREGEITVGPMRGDHGGGTWRPGGATISSIMERRVVRLWRSDLSDQVLERQRPVRLDAVTWNGDGTRLAVGDMLGLPKWWIVDPARTRTAWQSCAPHPFAGTSAVRRRQRWGSVGDSSVLFGPDGSRYAVERGGLGPLRLVDRHRGTSTVLGEEEGWWRWRSISFTPAGDRVVAAGEHKQLGQVLTVWQPTGLAVERPTARWFPLRSASGDRREPYVHVIRHIAVSDTHVAVIGGQLIGLFALDDLRNLCWIRANDTLWSGAFDPAGRRLAVVGDAGLYLFAVQGGAS